MVAVDSARQRKLKRTMDVAFSLLALALFTPVQAFVALASKLEDGGPLYFAQERIGRRGRPFRIYKLRTMREGKVTRLGRWLRATGLDETPQFLNVLRGEMSIVGPRPLTAHDLERLGWHALADHPRFAVAPGITGLGQIFGGSSPRQLLALDALYARIGAPWLDTQLIAASFLMNVLGKAPVKRWLQKKRDCPRVRSRAEEAGTKP
jgi:lipopolysaccharide/colanic/teichoic acid biosynthesis glycosyltransferase